MKRWTILWVLTGINLLNYIDRYIFSALLPAIKSDLHFSDTQLGLLGSAFIFSYLLVAPVFGRLGDSRGRFRLMSLGVSLWSVATAFSGIARNFTTQLWTRIVVGVGESAYTVIAPTVLADLFSREKRGRVFAVYSAALPVGSALGYLLGGLLEARLGWQKSFFVVGGPGLLLAVALLILREPQRGAVELAAEKPQPAKRKVYAELLRNGSFVCTVLGYTAYTFVVGGMAFWMPTYIVRYFDVSLERGNVIFGAITVAGGFFGTLIGGWWSDRWERRSGGGYLKVSVLSALLAAPLLVVALSMKGFSAFSVALFFAEVALFLCMSPLDAAVINFVPPGVRSTAMALNVFVIHCFGDGISRALIGSVSDAAGLQAAIAYAPVGLVVAGLIWSFAIVVFWQPVAWPREALSLPRRQAHRGYWKAGPRENSLAAFRLAKAHGAVMIELDVRRAKDGMVVVVHDEDLRRLWGLDRRVDEMSAADLKSLADIPSLAEVLGDPDVPSRVNIELKNPRVFGDGFEEAVCEVVRQAGAEGRVLFSSFNPFCLRRLSKLLPQVPRALLVSGTRIRQNRIFFRRMLLAWWARPHLLHLEQDMLTSANVQAWQQRHIPVVAWTVNDVLRAERFFFWGVKGIISDELFGEPSPSTPEAELVKV